MGKHKSKKHKKEKKRHKSRSSDRWSNSEEEWVEKAPCKEVTGDSTSKRDEWLQLPTLFTSTSNMDRKKEREETRRLEKEQNQYNPRSNVRELNPFWKDGGDGLPMQKQFKKPEECNIYQTNTLKARSSNWRRDASYSETDHSKETDNNDQVDKKELNVIAAKIIKAEIMGDEALVKQLKKDLEKATNAVGDDTVLLTMTDSKGYSRPVRMQSDYDRSYGNKRKKQKVETHKDGERVRYFANDDKYSLQQLFEEEKYNSVGDQNREFLKMSGKVRKNDDMDDFFTDDIRKKESDESIDKRNKSKAIHEHRKVTQSLDNCVRCLQSEEMRKHLMIGMGETMYLSLPHFKPLTDGHCFIIPVRHITCATQLEENEWSELLNFLKALNKMFSTREKSVVFFETAMYLNRFPHAVIECIPMPKEQGDLAPIFFKKAIDESETEWAMNKKLIRSQGPDIRKVVPKGLPYFSVSFGMNEGFAHVIEDEKYFPRNFAQEIIGGMLDLHHSVWRKPKSESFDEQNKRVHSFTDMWTPFDCTIQSL